MKKLGTVKNIIHDGTILLGMSESNGQDIPPHGARVYDQRGSEVGRVARVFGPVKAPYVSLRAKPDTDTLGLLGSSVYLDPDEKPVQKKSDRGGRSFTNRAKRRSGPPAKRGVNTYRRKEKQRKK